MAADIETVIQKAKAYTEDAKRVLPVEKAVLYGSYANGTAREHSDIDICFFMKDFGGMRRREILRELLMVLCDNGYYGRCSFEPNAYEMDDILRDDPFVKEVLRTGIEIL
jgi:predicted nucleotidyltransferase